MLMVSQYLRKFKFKIDYFLKYYFKNGPNPK